MSDSVNNSTGNSGKTAAPWLFSRRGMVFLTPVILAAWFTLSRTPILPYLRTQVKIFDVIYIWMNGTSGALIAGFLAVIVFLVLTPYILDLRRGLLYVDELIQGADNRPSTSKIQFFWWTTAVIFAFTAIKVRQLQTDSALTLDIPQTLFAAMGASVLTAIGAKTIAVNQANSQKRAPNATPAESNAAPANTTVGQENADENVPAAPPINSPTGNGAVSGQNSQPLPPAGDLRYAVTDDSGKADLTKIQMLSWTVLAIGIFLWKSVQAVFAENPAGSLPEIDVALVVLTGIAQGTYIGGKLVPDFTPWVMSLQPNTADGTKAEVDITITGKNFGNRQNDSLITIDEKPVVLKVNDWADNEIKFVLPVKKDTPEKVHIGVVVGGQVSANALLFTVIRKEKPEEKPEENTKPEKPEEETAKPEEAAPLTEDSVLAEAKADAPTAEETITTDKQKEN